MPEMDIWVPTAPPLPDNVPAWQDPVGPRPPGTWAMDPIGISGRISKVDPAVWIAVGLGLVAVVMLMKKPRAFAGRRRSRR